MKPLGRLREIACCVTLVLISLLGQATTAQAQGTASGTEISNYATTTYEDDNTNGYTAQSNTVKVTVSSVFATTITCTTVAQSAASNTTATYTCYFRNTGNASNTFTLSASSNPVGWTAALYADDGAGGGTAGNGSREANENNVPPAGVSVNADTDYHFFLVVSVPQHTANNQTASTRVTTTGGQPGGADDTFVDVTTTAKAPALSVQKKVRNYPAGAFLENGVTAKPNDTLEYQVKVSNGGTVKATKVKLEDTLDSHVTFVDNSLYAGNGTAFDTGNNRNLSNGPSGDAACAADDCGAGNHSGGKVTFYLGDGATESAGGSLNSNSFVYVYYRVTVN